MARKVILKENGLSESGTAPSGYKYFGDSGGDISQKVGATVSGIGGSTYKVVSGFFTQFSTNAPTLTILENTTGTTITASRELAGSTLIQSNGTPFTSGNKTFILCQSGIEAKTLVGRWAGTNLIVLRLFNTSGTLIDGSGATRKMFEIRIYP